MDWVIRFCLKILECFVCCLFLKRFFSVYTQFVSIVKFLCDCTIPRGSRCPPSRDCYWTLSKFSEFHHLIDYSISLYLYIFPSHTFYICFIFLGIYINLFIQMYLMALYSAIHFLSLDFLCSSMITVPCALFL